MTGYVPTDEELEAENIARAEAEAKGQWEAEQEARSEAEFMAQQGPDY